MKGYFLGFSFGRVTALSCTNTLTIASYDVVTANLSLACDVWTFRLQNCKLINLLFLTKLVCFWYFIIVKSTRLLQFLLLFLPPV